jgi:poly(A) polymerase Pap1
MLENRNWSNNVHKNELLQYKRYVTMVAYIRGSFEKFADWRQYVSVMQREVVSLMPSCSGGGNAVVA